MHFAVSEILGAKALLRDDTLKVREMFFSQESWTPEFLALDAGGWTHHDLALVGYSMVTAVDSEVGEVQFDLDREALDAAPRAEGESDPGFYQTLPPLIVGPFGATTAPLMMWAAMQQDAERPGPEEPHDLRADWIERRFERFAGWKGREVFGASGSLGRLDDLLVDAETRRITHMIVDRGMEGGKACAGIGSFRHVGESESGYIVTDLTAETLDAGTPPDTWHPRDRGWLSALRTF